jgi:tRNA modification GTPase
LVDGAAGDEAWREATGAVKAGDLCVINKRDLAPGAAAAAARSWAVAQGLELLDLSLADRTGLDLLEARLTKRVVDALSGAEFPAATQARHRRDLGDALVHVERARFVLSASAGVELAAEDVRLAARSLARIGGRIDPEDVLDRVFARFCIGK